MTTRLYLLTEVAEMTGLSARALADAARADRIKTHKIQGRRYMSQAQIDEYLASTVSGPGGGSSPAESEDQAWAKFLATRNRRRARNARKSEPNS